MKYIYEMKVQKSYKQPKMNQMEYLRMIKHREHTPLQPGNFSQRDMQYADSFLMGKNLSHRHQYGKYFPVRNNRFCLKRDFNSYHMDFDHVNYNVEYRSKQLVPNEISNNRINQRYLGSASDERIAKRRVHSPYIFKEPPKPILKKGKDDVSTISETSKQVKSIDYSDVNTQGGFITPAKHGGIFRKRSDPSGRIHPYDRHGNSKQNIISLRKCEYCGSIYYKNTVDILHRNRKDGLEEFGNPTSLSRQYNWKRELREENAVDVGMYFSKMFSKWKLKRESKKAQRELRSPKESEKKVKLRNVKKLRSPLICFANSSQAEQTTHPLDNDSLLY